MEETIKTRIIVILAILSVMFFIMTIGSCSSAYRQKLSRNREMATRLDLEEKMSKFLQEKMALDDKIKAEDTALEEEKAAHQATKKALVQEELVNQSLKEELQKVTKLKEALEDDLKEALTGGKGAKHKR